MFMVSLLFKTYDGLRKPSTKYKYKLTDIIIGVHLYYLYIILMDRIFNIIFIFYIYRWKIFRLFKNKYIMLNNYGNWSKIKECLIEIYVISCRNRIDCRFTFCSAQFSIVEHSQTWCYLYIFIVDDNSRVGI